ncbi:40S ribosomal protein S5-1 [Hordeum vulgare]|nr:40S ribosomal protein S5-1 [Hordeum vulgare]
MASSSSSKDNFYENVINPYLLEVMKHPQEFVTREGMLHTRDVQGPKRTGSMEESLKAVEQEILKCKVMVDHGLSANHSVITVFTRENSVGGQRLENIVLNLNDRIYYIQDQIYGLQLQNYEFEEKFKGMSSAAVSGLRGLALRIMVDKPPHGSRRMVLLSSSPRSPKEES